MAKKNFRIYLKGSAAKSDFFKAAVSMSGFFI